MIIQLLFSILFIIDIIAIIKLLLLIKNIISLRNNLIKSNCIIIYNKPERNHIYKIMRMIFDYFCEDYIFDINDKYKIIKMLTNQTKLVNLNIIYDTYGGDVNANDILLNYILESKIKINGYVFKKSQSAGTILALSSTNLYMNKNALLSPTDPQITIDTDIYSIKSIIDMCETKDKNYISDKYLLQYYENKKLHYENISTITNLLQKKFRHNISKNNKKKIINELTSGDYSHHKPLSGQYLNKYIDINLNMPSEINMIYKLYEDVLFYL